MKFLFKVRISNCVAVVTSGVLPEGLPLQGETAVTAHPDGEISPTAGETQAASPLKPG